MVRFSRVWRGLLRMGHPQVRWLVWLMTQGGLMPSQLQGDGGGVGALPLNWVECEFFDHTAMRFVRQALEGCGLVGVVAFGREGLRLLRWRGWSRHRALGLSEV